MTPSPAIHLAIIPDGNRRWAKTKGLLPWNGHERAMDNFRTLTDWCRSDPRIDVLTIWGFSTENWKRSEEEVTKLMDLFESYLERERLTFIERGTRFVHSGRTDRIPKSLSTLIAEVTEETKDCTDFTMHLAVDYGGKDEVVRAIKKMPVGGEVTEDVIRQYLDHPELPDIDLVLRTSGEQRTSNFFLWQSAYAEWLFVQKHFPELAPKDLEDALAEFNRRTRRFGGG
jgi:undecaprenyl diphosphate synthase